MDLIGELSSQLGGAFGMRAVLVAFVVGLLSTFTPCVYPLIPITISIFGASEGATRAKCFLLSLCYVLGIAVTYTALGIFVASTDTYFGALLGNTYVILGICAMLLILCAYTLEVFDIALAHRLQAWGSRFGGKGFVGAFIMGAMSGVVAAPCVGPALATILLYAASASAGSRFAGGVLLFAYSLGFGLPFLIIGTYREILRRVPRSGHWLLWIKFALGTAILCIAIFFASPLLKGLLLWSFFAQHTFLLLALAAAGFMLAFRYSKQSYSRWPRIVAAFCLSVPLYFLIIPGARPISPSISESGELVWSTSLKEALEKATLQNKILMVDLYADWCVACKEFESKTFSAPAVIQKLRSFELARIDFTSETEEVLQITKKYGVIGLPWILFLDANGTEIPDSNIKGFMGPDEFIKHLERFAK